MSFLDDAANFLNNFGGAIGGLASGGLNYAGQQSANQTNRDINLMNNQWAFNNSMINNAFNAMEAEKARTFQAIMSSTSFQRGMADMQAAGLNPILAFGKGGASTPSGASASGSPAQVSQGHPMVNPMAGATAAFTSANQARLTNLSLENLKADLFKKTEEANLSRAMQRTQEADRLLKLNSAKVAANQATNLASQLPSIQAESMYGKNVFTAGARFLERSGDSLRELFNKDKDIRFNRSYHAK